ncbi:CIC11C00000003496 [Sungouiella intermedia]|uniref:CIC11C00000003496 n=1 Tax=Sungouiella intermedia TaxID=45354 RepID=A0A1L0DMD1_9ASCO|nr:CIC11C00000003496 [[Candida] intermedia]
MSSPLFSSLPTISQYGKCTLMEQVFEELEEALASSIRDSERLSVLYEQVTSSNKETRSGKLPSDEDTVHLVCLFSKLQYVNNLLSIRLDRLRCRFTSPEQYNHDNEEDCRLCDDIPKDVLENNSFILETQRMLTKHEKALTKLQHFLWKTYISDALPNTTSREHVESTSSNPSAPILKLCSRNGKWVKTLNNLDLEHSKSGKLSSYGVLMKEYEKQCDNILLLERERNLLLLETSQLEEENTTLRLKNDELNGVIQSLRDIN